MTNTSTNAIIIDREAFITNFLKETVFFFPPEAKGYKLTCKIDKISFGPKVNLAASRQGIFLPKRLYPARSEQWSTGWLSES